LQGDIAGAIAAYEAAVACAPDFAEALGSLGDLYVRADRPDDALRAYGAAIRAKPDFAAVYCNLAGVLIDLAAFNEAILVLQTALTFASKIPELHANLGQAYRHAGRFVEAIAASQLAVELRPDYRDAYLNLAAAAYEIGRYDVALAASREAVGLDASSAATQYNLAWLCHATGRYAEAIDASEAAIALQPDFPEAHANLAQLHLTRGDLARGWREYAWTWRLPTKRKFYPHFDRSKLWDGEDFTGRELLITREQGLGDAIQMTRYLPLVKARGGRVVLEVAPPLASLFMNLGGIDELRVTVEGSAIREDVDLHIPLLGLPGAFRTVLGSIPTPIPYLRAPAEKVAYWRPRLERFAGLRVGIVWAGNPAHNNDHHRSARLEDFAILGAVDGVVWFGLQKGRHEELNSSGLLMLDPLGNQISDFADTAAILSHLDLVIAVDTAIVHLAGAMGKTVWTLLPFIPDWRWMLERSDSPWYPTMRLFRQPRLGDWESVLAEVAEALQGFVQQ
jgi:tetratricopeptide (TPR) repeat protein